MATKLQQLISNSTGIESTIFPGRTVYGLSTPDYRQHLIDLQENVKTPSVGEKAGEALKKPTWVLSFVIFIIGLIANILTIQAIMNIRRQNRSAHLKFVISLACSDILILFAIFSVDIIYVFTTLHSDCFRLIKTLLLDVPLIATLLNLLAMALDHYLGTFKQLHYRHLMTKSRVNHVICGIWLFSVVSVGTEIIIGLSFGLDDADISFSSFCMAIAYDSYNIEHVIVGTIFLVLFCIILIYIKIYYHVRRSLPKRPRNRRQHVSPSLKTLVTTILFIATFVLFWTPEGIFQLYMYLKTKGDESYVYDHLEDLTRVSEVLFLILQLNSLADPIIYAMRLPKVQQGLKQLFCKREESVQRLDKSNVQLKQTNLTHLTSLINLNRQV